MSNVLNIEIKQGADFQRVLTLKNNNVLIDLTGCTFRGQAREKYESPVAAFSFQFNIRNQVSETGVVDWLLSNTALVGLKLTEKKKYLYDIEIVYPNTKVERIIQGTVTVDPEVTKS